MTARAMTRAAALVMFPALVATLAVGRLAGVEVGFAASKPKDFTVTSQPVSAGVQRGQAATFRLSVAPVNGFTGTVGLSASKLSAGTTASFAPAQVQVGPGTPQSTFTVTTSSSTPLGTQTFTVTGTSGSTKRTLELSIVVSTPPTPNLAVGVTPSSITVGPGSTATYSVSVSRLNGYDGPVALTHSGTYPAGVVATITPSSIPSGTASPVAATLRITTTDATPSSTTLVTVTATGNAGLRSTVEATLVVDDKLSSKPFTIAGNVLGSLGPGIPARPLDLTITNPNNQDIKVTNLGVTVTGTSRSGCTAGDFTVRQYSGSYPLTVPRNSSAVSLTSLGVPTSALPTVAMLNKASNQDACKGVTVTLAYTGSATNQ